MSSSRISRPRYLSSAIAQQYESAFFGTQGENEVFFRSLLQHADSSPHRSGTNSRHIAGYHQQLGFVCLQLLGCGGRFRPPREPSFGETLLRKVVSLAVIAEETNRRSTATSKNKNAAGKRIFRELFLAYPSQGINALTPVNRLDRHQHAHLRRDMDHRSASCQSVSGSFVRCGCVLRNSSNRRCNCAIGSGMEDAFLLFNISRPWRLIERNKVS